MNDTTATNSSDGSIPSDYGTSAGSKLDVAISAMGVGFILAMVFALCLVGICSFRVGVRATRATGTAASPSNEERRRQEDRRKEFVKRNLVLRRWNSPDHLTVATGDECKEEESSGQKPRPARPDSQTGSEDTYPYLEKEGCAICLNGFRDGDIVCESNNVACDHVFHGKSRTSCDQTTAKEN